MEKKKQLSKRSTLTPSFERGIAIVHSIISHRLDQQILQVLILLVFC